jgi:hypothetical protein
MVAHRAGAGVQWTYDLRGLDLLTWAERAGDELAGQVAAGDRVTVLMDPIDAATVASVQRALAPAGCAVQPSDAAGIPALQITAAAEGA